MQFSFVVGPCTHLFSVVVPYRWAAWGPGVYMLVVSWELLVSFELNRSVSLMDSQASYKQLEFSFLAERKLDLEGQDTLDQVLEVLL